MKRELAVIQSTTMFQQAIRPANEVKGDILQPIGSNPKVGKAGKVVKVKKWKGLEMYSLTLVERETCPKDCSQWATCYGNNSPFRRRVGIDETLLRRIEANVQKLERLQPNGYVVRLHVLGDFFSAGYARFWQYLLETYPGLRLFGYTHYAPSTGQGRILGRLNTRYFERCVVRFSDRPDVSLSANVGTEGLVCPEQTGKTESCLTCGLCWTVKRPITFLQH